MRSMRFTALDVLAVMAIVAVALTVGGLGRSIAGLSRPPADPVIDGWVVGDELPHDSAYVDPATDLLAELHPEHAPVARASLHSEGIYYDKDGRQILWTRSGDCCLVVLFELADGSKRAIGAGKPGVSPTVMAFEIGPARELAGATDSP
jgi:hypothetical protein